jgi:hypothetical protein
LFARGAGKRGFMSQWIAVSEGFIEADVIRWTEGIFEKRRGKNARSVRIGERQVTAEVLQMTDDGWLRLLVRACVIIRNDFAGRRIPPLQLNAEIRRARKTIAKGKPERLLWSDEDARRTIVRNASIFLTSL